MIKKQIKLNTFNFTLQSLIGLLKNFKIGKYQRQVVWTLDQQKSFILFLTKYQNFGEILIENSTPSKQGIPIPKKIVDGQQRVTSLFKFFNNKLSIEIDSKEIFWKDLSLKEQSIFEDITCNLTYLNGLSEIEIAELYIARNSQGTRHSFADIEKAKNYLATLTK